MLPPLLQTEQPSCTRYDHDARHITGQPEQGTYESGEVREEARLDHAPEALSLLQAIGFKSVLWIAICC